MLRAIIVSAILALALPTLAMAQQHDEHGHPGPHPGGPPGHPPGPPARSFAPHGPVHGPVVPGPHPGFVAGVHPGPIGPHPQFGYHGHFFSPVHGSPFIYPRGWAYRSWGVGAVLPPLFLAPEYYYSDWAALGLDPPPPGTQWVRYGPDLLLVDVGTGNVIQVVPGVFYE